MSLQQPEIMAAKWSSQHRVFVMATSLPLPFCYLCYLSLKICLKSPVISFQPLLQEGKGMGPTDLEEGAGEGARVVIHYSKILFAGAVMPQVCAHVGLCSSRSDSVKNQRSAAALSRKLLASNVMAAQHPVEDPGQFCQFCQMAVNYIKASARCRPHKLMASVCVCVAFPTLSACSLMLTSGGYKGVLAHVNKLSGN